VIRDGIHQKNGKQSGQRLEPANKVEQECDD